MTGAGEHVEPLPPPPPLGVLVLPVAAELSTPSVYREADRLGDADYLAVLRARLPQLLDTLAPDLVFYNAGVDPHRDDRLGRLCLTDEGLLARDRFVVAEARARGIPLVAVIGGGYATDVEALAQRHALVFEALAAEAATESGTGPKRILRD